MEELEKRQKIVKVWMLDLCSYESVKRFAEQVQNTLPRVDILLENAGMAKYT